MPMPWPKPRPSISTAETGWPAVAPAGVAAMPRPPPARAIPMTARRKDPRARNDQSPRPCPPGDATLLDVSRQTKAQGHEKLIRIPVVRTARIWMSFAGGLHEDGAGRVGVDVVARDGVGDGLRLEVALGGEL